MIKNDPMSYVRRSMFGRLRTKQRIHRPRAKIVSVERTDAPGQHIVTFDSGRQIIVLSSSPRCGYFNR